MNTTYIVPLGLGLIAGTLLSIAYFMHLARQIRFLYDKTTDGYGLLLGAVLRMSVLLATGWLLSAVLGPVSAVGYGVAFLLVRTLAIQRTRKEVMSLQLTPDTLIYFQMGGIAFNATIVNTWIIMALITGLAALATRRLRPDVPPNRWRTLLEVIVQGIATQIREIAPGPTTHVLYFAGTLFLFILVSNLLTVVPGFHTPTASLSTTTALAATVLLAVPIFGISRRGFVAYLKSYAQPTPIMLPLNIMGEVSRGISLAIRLYGNIMSGAVIVAILLSIAPFFFPVLMEMLGLLTGVIQAYIFAILATVYIASACPPEPDSQGKNSNNSDQIAVSVAK